MWLTPVRTRKVPSTVVTPTASGISAARPRKNRIESTISSGNASSSANPRSLVTDELTCSLATAGPPTVTPRSPENAATAALAEPLSSARADSVAVTSTLRPSRETSAGAWVRATPGTVFRRALRAAIRPRAAVGPLGVLTRSTSPGTGSVPEACWSIRVATCESELGGANPPELFSDPARGPPMAPARTTNARVSRSVRRGWAESVLASDRSMHPIVRAPRDPHNRPGDVSLPGRYSPGCTPRH